MSHNLGLKFLSLVIAVFLWAFVRVTVQGPFQAEAIAQITLDLPLQLQGKEPNLIPYEYSADRVRVTLKGKPDVVNSLREGLVRAYVNLEGLVEGTHVPEVKVLAPPEVVLVDKDPASVTLRISPVVGRSVPVQIGVTGTPAERRTVGKPAVQPLEVNVRGAAALVSQVTEVRGQVALNGQSQAYSVEVADLRPVNEAGTIVQGTNYRLGLKPSSVTVTVPIEAEGSTFAVPVDPDIKDSNRDVHFIWQPDYVTIRVSEGQEVPAAIRTAPIYFDQVTQEEAKTVPLLLPVGVEAIGGSTVVIHAIPIEQPGVTPGNDEEEVAAPEP